MTTSCRQCTTTIDQEPGGREREYCTNACRQKAYRARKLDAPAADQAQRAELADARRRIRAAAADLSNPAIARLLRAGGDAAEAIIRAASHLSDA